MTRNENKDDPAADFFRFHCFLRNSASFQLVIEGGDGASAARRVRIKIIDGKEDLYWWTKAGQEDELSLSAAGQRRRRHSRNEEEVT